MKILLVGGGGREHALAWKMSQSGLCERLWAAPGNPGIAEEGECVDISADDTSAIVGFAKDNGVGMVVVGPEGPLAAGLADDVRGAGILCFGPSAQGARIEADKAYAKDLMRSASVPTADGRIFTDLGSAKDYVLSRDHGVAVKAAGLAQGKGVIVCPEPYQAIKPLEEIMGAKIFGDAGNTVIVIEHNMDVIKTADYIIDLGPEGGDKGGEVVACGTPEKIARNKKSYTGQYLKEYL